MTISDLPTARVAAAFMIAACQTGSVANIPEQSLDCSIPRSQIHDGGPGKDGIPALVNPLLVEANQPGAAYLRADDRVMGLVVDGRPIAVPLNIQWCTRS